MTLPNDSVLVTPGSGATVATHLVSAKEYQVVMTADPDGHIFGSAPVYLLYQQPRVATAAATDFFDFFNATGSGKVVRLRGIWCALQITATVAFTASFQFEFRRTSAVGTGGTVATFETTGTPAAGAVNISRISTTDATLPAQITARSLPTGGATNSHFLFNIALMGEETQPSTSHLQLTNWLPELPGAPPFELQENQGFKLRQITAVASTGMSIGWLVAFATVP